MIHKWLRRHPRYQRTDEDRLRNALEDPQQGLFAIRIAGENSGNRIRKVA